jgi:dihydroorotate dehydrogenase electron transfer subunit
MTIFHTDAKVVSNKQIAPETLLICLEAPEIASIAQPGQFVMVGPLDNSSNDPFLNRPFSIHRNDYKKNIELLIGIVGRGTRLLGELRPGDCIGVLGPVGRGFEIAEEYDSIFLVGGGLGIAPLFYLAERLIELNKTPYLLYGAKTADLLIPTEELEKIGVHVQLATDDGSQGQKGTAVDLLKNSVSMLTESQRKLASIVACGPMVMLEAVAQIGTTSKMSVEVSLESRMACGVGACLGCTTFFADGDGKSICQQGPVFSAQEVFGR